MEKKISHVPSSPHHLSVPQEAPYFVKANKVDLPADINPLWADAENLLFLQPPLGINSARCQGSRDSGRHSHGEEEEGHSHHICHRLLRTARATGAMGWEQPPCPATVTLGGVRPSCPGAMHPKLCPWGWQIYSALFCPSPPQPPPPPFLASENWITEVNNIPRILSDPGCRAGTCSTEASLVLTLWETNTHTV